ncbi:AAA family ATPase, partial [Candidatus Pacearchaeota archaeon]|nr:AAA family ATPase [Candidatus Pacearchaeota archaeon]
HCTGKTTVAYELVAELRKKGKNSTLLEEVARDCPLPVNENTTEDAQKWILFTQLANEIKLAYKYPLLICDRSVLDGYAYYFNKFGENFALETIVKDHLKTYSFLFKMPITGSLVPDGFRSINAKFQKDIDEKIDYLLGKFNQAYFDYTSVEDILDKIYNKS